VFWAIGGAAIVAAVVIGSLTLRGGATEVAIMPAE